MSNSIRVLYIGFNVKYINPTRELLIKSLKTACDLTCFGPGFNHFSLVNSGIQKFYDDNGPFDIVISDEYVLQEHKKDNIKNIRFVNHSCDFDKKLLRNSIEYREFLKKCNNLRIICLLQIDYYNVSKYFIDGLYELSDFILGWGAEFITDKNDVEDNYANTIDKYIYSKWNNNYYNFARKNSEKIISIPHIIDDNEFKNSLIHDRKRDWVVPGASYQAREIVRDKLKANSIRQSGIITPYIFSLFSKLKINPYAHGWSIALLRHVFMSSIHNSKYGFTCGSIARMAVRKIFEIPASGCVMVCEPPTGFKELGFIDKHSAIITSPEDILEVYKWLECNCNRAQILADNGRELVKYKHSVKARSSQIRGALKQIHNGSFRGSRWCSGSYILNSND